jgi:hypothetical protein
MIAHRIQNPAHTCREVQAELRILRGTLAKINREVAK